MPLQFTGTKGLTINCFRADTRSGKAGRHSQAELGTKMCYLRNSTSRPAVQNRWRACGEKQFPETSRGSQRCVRSGPLCAGASGRGFLRLVRDRAGQRTLMSRVPLVLIQQSFASVSSTPTGSDVFGIAGQLNLRDRPHRLVSCNCAQHLPIEIGQVCTAWLAVRTPTIGRPEVAYFLKRSSCSPANCIRLI